MNENNFKDLGSKLDPQKLQNVGDLISKTTGISADALNSFLNDKDKISALASKLRPGDIDKISKLLDNPAKLKEMLSSKKAADNLKKYID